MIAPACLPGNSHVLMKPFKEVAASTHARVRGAAVAIADTRATVETSRALIQQSADLLHRISNYDKFWVSLNGQVPADAGETRPAGGARRSRGRLEGEPR